MPSNYSGNGVLECPLRIHLDIHPTLEFEDSVRWETVQHHCRKMRFHRSGLGDWGKGPLGRAEGFNKQRKLKVSPGTECADAQQKARCALNCEVFLEKIRV